MLQDDLDCFYTGNDKNTIPSCRLLTCCGVCEIIETSNGITMEYSAALLGVAVLWFFTKVI